MYDSLPIKSYSRYSKSKSGGTSITKRHMPCVLFPKFSLLSVCIIFCPMHQHFPLLQRPLMGSSYLPGKLRIDEGHRCRMKKSSTCYRLRSPPPQNITLVFQGANLSGGQRSRIALARAVYQQKQCYLLDDVLSSVDKRVGRHVFQRVFGRDGLLRQKTRIFVTHTRDFLEFVDQVIVLEGRKAL